MKEHGLRSIRRIFSEYHFFSYALFKSTQSTSKQSTSTSNKYSMECVNFVSVVAQLVTSISSFPSLLTGKANETQRLQHRKRKMKEKEMSLVQNYPKKRIIERNNLIFSPILITEQYTSTKTSYLNYSSKVNIRNYNKVK